MATEQHDLPKEVTWVSPRLGPLALVLRTLGALFYLLPMALFLILSGLGMLFLWLVVNKAPPVTIWLAEGSSGWVALLAIVLGVALWIVLALAALLWVWRCARAMWELLSDGRQ